jgi:chromosome partitioning protein
VPKIITVANLKGGCGKSTIAVNLAGELATRKAAVTVVIDADGQGTATSWAEAGRLPFRVDSLPLEDPRDGARWIERVLSLDAAYLVVDCPPHVGAATEAAVGVSDLVLIPVFSSGADLRATVQALDLVGAARADRKDRGPACLLVPSRIDRRTLVGREIESVLKQFGEPIAPVIHQRAAFIDCLTESQWIGDYAPDSQAHADITALALAVKRRLKL